MMLTDRIIGRVGADILGRRLADGRQGDGSVADSAALFRLDKLSSSQIAAIVKEILANPDLREKIDVRIPESLVRGEGLPDEALTTQNAGAVRNAGTLKEALLTANGNESNLADTLGHVTGLGAKELRAAQDAWVDAACHVGGIAPTLDDRHIFQSALKGLVGASDLSLIQLGDFCAMVTEAIATRGYPIREAIGFSLPCVSLPRDTSFFSNAKTYAQTVGPWRKAFEKLFVNRAPLLQRLHANGLPLDAEDMKARMQENEANIPEAARVALDAFINAPQGDDWAANHVSLLEWERDGVHFIFEKPKERQLGLADSTLRFFDHDCEDNDVLDAVGRQHLEDLKGREKGSDIGNEDDEAFFELHRRYLEQSPKLHARWEKAVFGKPLDCHDFLDGFANVAQRLIASNGPATGERFLRFTVAKGRTEWRERFNYDVGCYFSAMYRGVKELMGSKVDWRVERMRTSNLPDPLFQYREFFAAEKKIRGDKLRPVVSLARNSIQIKFDVSLVERMGDEETMLEKTQLLWSYRPESIGLSLVEDMERLLDKGAVGCTEVPRRVVSKKGGVQSVSLMDTSTLEATFSRDAGSLVPPPSKLRSQRADIKRRIDELRDEGRLSKEQRDEIRSAWDAFEADYIQGMSDFSRTGLHGEAVSRQAESFAALLRALAIHARGDVCRSRLVAEILTIGTVRVAGDQASLIIPPWHPERMKALSVKTRRVAALVTHMLGGENVLFGDRGIFFREFAEELAHPFYPEVAAMQRSGVPALVAESSTVNGYSLFERPVGGNDDNLTDVDPASAAKQVRELVERFVGLQPHEANNLSVLLYNADAAELPLAVVRELAGLQTEFDFQCNVSVRHRDPGKLRRVYAELVTKGGDDPDMAVVSETSSNFIAKLRIAVATSSSTPLRSPTAFATSTSPFCMTSSRAPRASNGFLSIGPMAGRAWSTHPRAGLIEASRARTS